MLSLKIAPKNITPVDTAVTFKNFKNRQIRDFYDIY